MAWGRKGPALAAPSPVIRGSWHCSSRDRLVSGRVARASSQRRPRPRSGTKPAPISAARPPSEWPPSTTPCSPAGAGPNAGSWPSRWASSTACRSARRWGRVSAPGGGASPSSDACSACWSLPGWTTTNTGQPRSARAAANQLSWSALPPRPGISNSQGPRRACWAGHSSSGRGATRWGTGSCRRWGSRRTALVNPKGLELRWGRGSWRNRSRAVFCRCSWLRHWPANCSAPSRRRVTLATGRARSSSRVETLLCRSSNRRRLLSSSGAVLRSVAPVVSRLPASLSICSPVQLLSSCSPKLRSRSSGACSKRTRSRRLCGSSRLSHAFRSLPACWGRRVQDSRATRSMGSARPSSCNTNSSAALAGIQPMARAPVKQHQRSNELRAKATGGGAYSLAPGPLCGARLPSTR